MKTANRLLEILLLLMFSASVAKTNTHTAIETTQNKSTDVVSTLIDTLNQVLLRTQNELLRVHYQSIIDVIEARPALSTTEISQLTVLFNVFENNGKADNLKIDSTYINRRFPLIIAWTSPIDGMVSFTQLKLPANWDPNKSYPLYIMLHGLWDVANSTIDYMTYPYRGKASTTFAFEDGYLISPWGRGNYWYQGDSETDIGEAISAIQELVHIDISRKYLAGHSMGGYGTWSIASKYPKVWAAIGLYAAALQYSSPNLLTLDVAEKLKDVPAYFVTGTNDGLMYYDQEAYYMLQGVGNDNTKFVTFVGGHEYLSENVEEMYLWMREFKNENVSDAIELKKQNTDIKIYPNPFKATIHFKVNMRQKSRIKLTVLDCSGKTIDVPADTYLPKGEYDINFTGSKLKAGIYYYRLQLDNTINIGKIVKY